MRVQPIIFQYKYECEWYKGTKGMKSTRGTRCECMRYYERYKVLRGMRCEGHKRYEGYEKYDGHEPYEGEVQGVHGCCVSP